LTKYQNHALYTKPTLRNYLQPSLIWVVIGGKLCKFIQKFFNLLLVIGPLYS